MSLRRFSAALALTALPMGAILMSASPASAADLPMSFNTGASGNISLHGSECLSASGPGIATVQLTAHTNGATETRTVAAADDGTWSVYFDYAELPSPYSPYTATATCDLYEGVLQHQSVTIDNDESTPWVGVDDATVTPGQTITVEAGDFNQTVAADPNSAASVYLDPTLPPGVAGENGGEKVYDWPSSTTLADIAFDSDRHAAVTVTIPTGTEPGDHAIAVIQGDWGAYTTITVTAAGTGSGSSQTKVLAATGTHTGSLAAIAAAAVVTGGAATYIGRRKQR